MWLSTIEIFRMVQKKKTRILCFISSRNWHFNINACGAGGKKKYIEQGWKKVLLFWVNTNAIVVVYPFRTMFLRSGFQFVQNRNQIKAHSFGSRRLCLKCRRILSSYDSGACRIETVERFEWNKSLSVTSPRGVQVIGLRYRVAPKERGEHWWFKRIWETFIIF